MYVRYKRVRRHQRRVAVGSPIAVVDDVLTRPHGEVANAAPVGFTSRGPTTVASGGMRSVGVVGGGLG